jgi:putative oxidoreductase
MAEENTVTRLARIPASLAPILQPIVPLITRLVVGEAFILTGLGKWKNLDGVTALFTKIHIPAPHANAVFIASLELVGGACLILGLGTRVFSLLLSATMVVALMTADRADFLGAFDPSAEKGFMDVVPLVYLIPLLWLAAFGAGPFAIDRLFRKSSD